MLGASWPSPGADWPPLGAGRAAPGAGWAAPGSGWASSSGTGRVPSWSQQEARRPSDIRPAEAAGCSSGGDCSRQMSIA